MAVRPIDEGASPYYRAQSQGTATGAVRRNAANGSTQPGAPQQQTKPIALGDSVDFSKGALDAAAARKSANPSEGPNAQSAPGNENELTSEEQQQVQKLKQRDAEVRRHEQAHISAAGGYARGGANFSYTTGPDGKRYATGGEVSIDTGAERTPQATIAKMEVVKRAALAPAQPSSQDRAVYAQASAAEREAQQELAKANIEKGTAGVEQQTTAMAGETAAVAEAAPEARNPTGGIAITPGNTEKTSTGIGAIPTNVKKASGGANATTANPLKPSGNTSTIAPQGFSGIPNVSSLDLLV